MAFGWEGAFKITAGASGVRREGERCSLAGELRERGWLRKEGDLALLEREGDECQLLAGRMSGKLLSGLQEGRERDGSDPEGAELLGSEWGRGMWGWGEIPRGELGVGLAGGWGWQAGSRGVLGQGSGERQQELSLGPVPAPLRCGWNVGAAPRQSRLSPAPLPREVVWELGESSPPRNGSRKAFGGRVRPQEREGMEPQ